jgi:hydroxyacylglutathione hydrolase
MTLPTSTKPVRIIPIVDEGLGNQSYVVALADGRALVIDPSRDPTPYLRQAETLDSQIAFAVETHLHADFVSGSRELAANGATILAPDGADLKVGYRRLKDGDELNLDGRLTLKALATPGHTPEHLAYLLLDDGAPQALLTGGALIPGGAARTDLIDPEETEGLARSLHRSVRERLARLPDDLVVYPTHGAGSFCSAGNAGERTTTLGHERKTNPLLTTSDEDAFIRAFLASLGSYPTYFHRLRALNRQGARLFGTALPELRRLPLERVRKLLEGKATLIDTRPYPEFAAGHIPGALSIAFRPAFASWLGWLVPPDRQLIFVLAEGQHRAELIKQCLKIGHENLAGELEGGMAAWRAVGLPERTVRLRQLDDDLNGALLDVRQTSEWDGGHLPGARHIELGAIKDSNGSVSPGPMTIYCGHGDRAMTAASLLEAAGHHDLTVLDGGFTAWSRAGRPIAQDR